MRPIQRISGQKQVCRRGVDPRGGCLRAANCDGGLCRPTESSGQRWRAESSGRRVAGGESRMTSGGRRAVVAGGKGRAANSGWRTVVAGDKQRAANGRRRAANSRHRQQAANGERRAADRGGGPWRRTVEGGRRVAGSEQRAANSRHRQQAANGGRRTVEAGGE